MFAFTYRIYVVSAEKVVKLSIKFAFKQEFSRSMDLSQHMKEFASSLVAKATTNSSPRSSLLRNYSDVSLSDMGDDKCFALTKALGYHVIYGWFFCFLFFKVEFQSPFKFGVSIV